MQDSKNVAPAAPRPAPLFDMVVTAKEGHTHDGVHYGLDEKFTVTGGATVRWLQDAGIAKSSSEVESPVAAPANQGAPDVKASDQAGKTGR